MPSIFTKILNGEIPGTILHSDEVCAVIVDIIPQAPHHLLIFPKKEIQSLDTATEDDKKSLGHMLFIAAQIAKSKGFSTNGYRVVINTGKDGGQTVSHLHLHLLGGRPMTWPPG